MFENIRDYVHVPSVQMQAVPELSVGQALRMTSSKPLKADDPDDEVEERIRGEFIGVCVWVSVGGECQLGIGNWELNVGGRG